MTAPPPCKHVPANLLATLSTQRLLTKAIWLRDWPGSLSKKYSLVFSRHHLHGSMEKQQPSHEPEWPNGHEQWKWHTVLAWFRRLIPCSVQPSPTTLLLVPKRLAPRHLRPGGGQKLCHHVMVVTAWKIQEEGGTKLFKDMSSCSPWLIARKEKGHFRRSTKTPQQTASCPHP